MSYTFVVSVLLLSVFRFNSAKYSNIIKSLWSSSVTLTAASVASVHECHLYSSGQRITNISAEPRRHYLRKFRSNWKSTSSPTDHAGDSWRFLPKILDTSGPPAGIDLPLKGPGSFPADWGSGDCKEGQPRNDFNPHTSTAMIGRDVKSQRFEADIMHEREMRHLSTE